MPKIRYIGSKARKEDNVAGTGTVWEGKGDVKEVSDKSAALLLGHPGVWQLADGERVAPPDVAEVVVDVAAPKNEMTDVDAKPPLVNLDTMDRDALRDYAQRHFGHEFHANTGEPKMRQTILGLMNRG